MNYKVNVIGNKRQTSVDFRASGLCDESEENS